jgi:hypothetical protein
MGPYDVISHKITSHHIMSHHILTTGHLPHFVSPHLPLIRYEKLKRRNILEMEGYNSEAAMLRQRLSHIEKASSIVLSHSITLTSYHSFASTLQYMTVLP